MKAKSEIRYFMLSNGRFFGGVNYIMTATNGKEMFVYQVMCSGENILTNAWNFRDIKRLVKRKEWREFKFITEVKKARKK